jgi:phosphoribosyl 1,2-cyclic phosphodiesterase
MQVRFWGTRGSIAKPGPTTVRYGGNTSCVEIVTSKGTRLVIDCGTGGHELGQAIMREGKPSRGHMLISHTHWDHIQGIPFFTPFFVPGHEWDLYAPQGFSESLKDTLAGQMEYTYFPVTPEAFGATVRYNNLGEGRFVIDDIAIQTRYLNHPALALAFRIECDGASVIYACDHEPHAADVAHGEAVLEGEDLAHAQFMTGADLIIHDAQYLPQEYAAKRGWGHSTLDYAVLIARTAGARRIALTHHDPTRTDDDIDRALERLRNAATDSVPEIIAAAEGLILELGSADAVPALVDATNAAAAIRSGPSGDRANLLLVAASDDLADRIARAVADEPVDLTRVRSESEALTLVKNLQPGLILAEDGLESGGGLRTVVSIQPDTFLPLVLLGGTGPTGDDAVDRLDEPWSVEYARTRIRTWLMRSECHWIRAPIPDDETARLAALKALGVLDTPPEDRFDRTTRLAAALFNVPVALVSLVDADRQWFKSCFGVEICETPRETSFCAHAIAAKAMLVVPDALADDRFRDNPMVADGPRVRFYAGAPIRTPDGHLVGTLCILDVRPRDLSEAERGLLLDLAATVEGELSRQPKPLMM